jgi:hypothetical protein
MKDRAAIALILLAFAAQAVAQRGSAHGGSFGSRGFGGGHASYSSRPAFSAHPGYSARPAFAAHPRFTAPRSYPPSAPFRFGPLGPPPSVRFNPPRISTPRFTGGRSNFAAPGPAYRADYSGRDHGWDHNGRRDWDHDGDRDRDRFRDRARSFHNWYLYSYPSFAFFYPYDFGSGFYDWSGYDTSGYDQNYQQSGETPGYNDQGSGYQQENPGGDDGQPDSGDYSLQNQQPQPWPEPPPTEPAPGNHFTVSGLDSAMASPLEGPITVVFKGNRAPEKMQNYMLTETALTDLDADHYEKIPLNQIDITATAEANRASGVEFQVPGASPD